MIATARTLCFCALLLPCVCGSVTESYEEDKSVEEEKGVCEVLVRKSYEEGQQWSGEIGECVVYSCGKDGVLTALTCADVGFPDDSDCFRTEMDLTKPYPECCPRILCPLNNSTDSES